MASPPVPAAEELAPSDDTPEQARRRMLAADHGVEIADAILAGRVLKEMTMDQVLLARGTPERKEVIPPDAELWHYAGGEVAFSGGKVSFADLGRQPVTADPPGPAPQDEVGGKAQDTKVAERNREASTATLHTPGDGFLALRSDPTIRRGKRLVKIPHGTRLTLGECVTNASDGCWCRTAFQGQPGWVFERYLIR